jgi:hypothetical protein
MMKLFEEAPPTDGAWERHLLLHTNHISECLICEFCPPHYSACKLVCSRVRHCWPRKFRGGRRELLKKTPLKLRQRSVEKCPDLVARASERPQAFRAPPPARRRAVTPPRLRQFHKNTICILKPSHSNVHTLDAHCNVCHVVCGEKSKERPRNKLGFRANVSKASRPGAFSSRRCERPSFLLPDVGRGALCFITVLL